MKRITEIVLIMLITFVITIQSCDKKTKKSGLVPVRDLVPILTDLYIADGLLSYQPLRMKYNAKDSVTNYMDVIDKHGYTKEQVDRTLKYYFFNNQKKLQNVYDQVLARLSEIQSEIETEIPPLPSANLWNQKQFFSLPEDGVHNTLFFSIPAKDTGMYVLSFTAILYNDDQGLNPRTSVYFWKSDETSQGVRDPWEPVSLIRDGTRHTYTLSKRLTDTTFTHISGWLLDNDDQKIRWEKHAKVSSIFLVKGQIE
jgi:hypothetical protein